MRTSTTTLPAIWLVYCLSCNGNSANPTTHTKMSSPNERPANSMIVSDTTRNAINSLDNGHLQWEGTPVGLVPTIYNKTTHALIASGEAVDAMLVEKLRDPQVFAVAHVILTQRGKDAFSSDGGQWNQLRVDLAPDGSVTYHPDDRQKLYEFWKNRF